MQEKIDPNNQEIDPISQDADVLDEADLEQVAGGGHGHGNGQGNNKGKDKGGSSTQLGDGSVRFINPSPGTVTSITDGTSNTISFGEKQ